MAKEKLMTFVQVRSQLSEIVDRVAESGDTYVVSKRQKPVAVIIGIDKYRELSGRSKYLKNVGGKRIINLEGIATAVGDIDEPYASCASHGSKPSLKSPHDVRHGYPSFRPSCYGPEESSWPQSLRCF